MITSAGVELNDVGGSLSWGAFASFIKHLDQDSALWRSANPEYNGWGTTLRTNIILSDIYDILAQINVNLVALGSRKRPQRITPYEAPWRKKKEKKTGSGALPVDKLEEWIEMKRNKYRRGKDGTG